MNKIYSLRLVDGYLRGRVNGLDLILSAPTYFNPHSGLLYTRCESYIVMSYQGNQYQTIEFIQDQLNQVWETV